MAGEVGGCLGIEPIRGAGDSVIRPLEKFTQSVDFPEAEALTQTMTQTVSITVT
jgi:hypothetical protein